MRILLHNQHHPIHSRFIHRWIVSKSAAVILLITVFFFAKFDAHSQSINSVTVLGSPVCAGSSVTVNFNVVNGTGVTNYFNSNTLYQVFISDASGSNFSSLGTAFKINVPYSTSDNGTTTGLTTSLTIPSNYVSGTGYKISIGSTSPEYIASTGQNSLAAFTVNAQVAPSVSISANPGTTICAGTNVTFTATTTNAGATPGYQWKLNGVNIPGETGTTLVRNNLANADKITVLVTPLAASCPNPTTATSNELTMTVNPLLNVSVNISASSTIICSGNSVSFTAAVPINGGLSPGYQWQISTNGGGSYADVSGQTSSTFTTTSLTNGNLIRLKLTSSESCTNTNPVLSGPITMTVNPNQPVSVSIAASATTICAGTNVTFTATPTNGGTTPAYQWKLNGANVGTNSNTYSSTTLAAGNMITVELTSNVTCATGNPATSNGITMSVNPNLPVSVSVAASATTICAGTNVTFTATPTNGGTTPAYQWKLNGVNVGTNSNTYSSNSLNNNDVISVVLTSNAGCVAGNPATSSGVIMTINPNLPVSVSIAASTTTICAGTNVTFTATPTNGGSIPAYQWKLNGANVGTNSNTYSTTTLANGNVITVELTSNAVCATGSPATSNGIPMSVNSNLPVSVSVAASATTICAGTNVTFTATPTNGGTTPTFQWKLNGANVGTNTNTYSSTNINHNDIITVVLTSNATCVSGNPATSTGITMTVNPNLPVSVSIAASATTICPGTNVTFTATPSNGGSSPAYQWKLNGANVGTNSNTYSSTSLTNGNVITVVITSNATCATGSPATSNGITMIVNPTLVPSVNMTSTSTSICTLVGTPVTFTATPTNGGTSPSYLWKNNGVNIVGATSSTYTSSSLANGSNITVTMTSNAVCATPATVNSAGIAMTSYTGNPNFGNGNPKISSNFTSICPPANIILTAPTASNTQYYEWNLPSGWSIISGAGTRIVTVSVSTASSTGFQDVTVKAINPCGFDEIGSSNKYLNVNSFTGVVVNPTTQTVCSNGTITVLGTLTGNATSASWSSPSGTFSNIVLNDNPLTVSAVYTPSISSGSVVLTITTNNPTGCSTQPGSATVALTVNQVVNIATQPATSQTSCTGSNATFTVNATGTGLTYQWRKGTTNLSNGGNISGATSATLTLTNLASGDAGNYNLVVSGAGPCAAMTSNNAALIINDAISITTQPTALLKCTGTSAIFSVAATGTGLTYQWYKGSTALGNSGNITGALTNTLTINPLIAADASADYHVIITGTSPCAPVTSTSVSLVVNDAVVITAQPTISQTSCTGSTATFNITATGSGVTYQWRKGTTNLSNGANIAGATSATLTLTNLVAADAGNYNVIVNGTAPCGPVTSSDGALVVNTAITIITQPVALTKCTGTSAIFSIIATGTGLTYQWYKGSTALTNSGNISGALTNTLTINPLVAADASADYHVTITGTAPCAPVTSSIVSLAINDAVIISAQPTVSQTYCTGSTSTFNVTATGTGVTYQWRKGTTNLTNGGNISGATGATLTLTNLVAADAGNYNVIVNGTAPCGPVTSNDAALVVNTAIIITTQPVALTKCTGTSAIFSMAATGTGLTYQWYKGSMALTNSGNISGALTNTLTINPLVATDAAADYHVMITGASPCAPVTSSIVSLAINDAVLITAQPTSSQTSCTGSTASFTVTATGSGVTYQWRKGTSNLTNGGNISGATSATLTLTNLVAADAGNYNVIVSGTAPCGPVTSTDAALVVNAAIIINTQPVNVGICASSPASFGAVASGGIVSYQWFKGTYPGTAVSNTTTISGATSNILSFSQVSVADAGVYFLQVNGAAPCLPVLTTEVTLNVSQSISITTQPSSQVICQNNSVTFTVTAVVGGSALSYQWRKGGVAIAGATSSSYTINNVAVSDAGNYDVIISGSSSFTCPTATSATATLSVTPTVGTPTAISFGAGTEPICQLTNSTTVTNYATTATNNVSFNWSINNTSAGSINTNTGVMTWANGFSGTVDISVIANGCNSFSAQVIRTVNINPSVGAASAITIAAGTEPTCQLINGTTTTTYLAIATNNTGFNWSISNAAAGSINATTGVMTWANGFSGSVDIRVTANGCNGPTSQVIKTVNITPTVGTPPTITISAGTEPACQLTNSTTTTTYATTATNNTGFNWSLSNALAGSINATTGLMTWANGFVGTVDIRVTANGCNGPSPMVIRTVNITPVSGTPTAISIGAGSEPNCQLTNAATTTSYSTTATNNSGFIWSISNAAAGSINVGTGLMTWANGFSGTVDIRVAAIGCNGPSTQVIKTVIVTPSVGTPTAITISAGTEPTCQLSNGTTTTNYATTAINNTGFNWSISNAAAGTISPTTGLMNWANGFSGTVDIRVTATGCNGPTSQVARTVNVQPNVGTPTAITISSGTEPSCQIINSTTTTTYATTATNNTGFNWSISNASAGSISATTGLMSWTNGFAGTVIIRATANGCNGISSQVTRTVTVLPSVSIPVFALGATTTRCQGGGTVTYTASANNTTGITYSIDAASTSGGNVINATTGAVTYSATWSGTTTITASPAGCNGPVIATHAVVTNPTSVGGNLSITGASIPANVKMECQNGSGTISLSGHTGTINKWQSSINGGGSWLDISNTSTSLNYSAVFVPTIYRAEVQSGSCSISYSGTAVLNVVQPIKPGSVKALPNSICIGESAVLSANISVNQMGNDINEAFNNANPAGWLVRVNGVPNNFPANANNSVTNEWSESNGPKTFFGPPDGPTVTYNNSQVGTDGKFAVSTGRINTTLETPIFSLLNTPSAALNMFSAYRFYGSSYGQIEMSLDGGVTYQPNPLVRYQGTTALGVTENGWVRLNIDLSNYLGQDNLRIRFNFVGQDGPILSTWALDNLTIPSAAPTVGYLWTPATGLASNTGTPVTATPTVTTVYTVTSIINGCPAGSDTVRVTVKASADAIPSSAATPVCASPTVQTSSIAYTNAINAPDKYSIVWNTSPTNSFVNVTDATLPASKITFNVPANTAPGTYTGTLTVKNNSFCAGPGRPFSITVNPRPTAVLAGTTKICLGSSATITIPVTGPGTISGQLTGGINFSGTAPNITVVVSPTVTTTYNITSLTNGCTSLTSDYSGTHTVTVVKQVSFTSQPVSTEACVGANITFTAAALNVAASSGYQWQVRTTPTGTFTNINDGSQYTGTTTQNLTIINVSLSLIDNEYRLVVNSEIPCNSINSELVKIRVKNVWTGGTSIDWMTGSNWSNGAPPTLSCLNTYILGGRSFQPTLSFGTGTVNNLIIEPNAYLTVKGTGRLGVAGLITRDPSATLDLLAGELLLFGKTTNPFAMLPQTIDGLIFKEKTIYRLTIDNNVNVIGNDTLKISGALGFENLTANKTFNASTKNVTLLSTQSYTANVNEIKDGNVVLGNNFTVERFISTGVVHIKSWQLLGTAITGQNVLDSWQEKKILRPGLGTNIPSNLVDASFDGTAFAASMKVYNPVIDNYEGIPNTLIDLANPKGYYIFVRGDRSVTGFNDPANKTTLRSTGTLNTGNLLPKINVPAGLYQTIGNPYASTIDLRKIYADHSSFLTTDVYVWDPNLSGAYGVGGYRTLTFTAGDYKAVPAGGFYTTISNYIQSGQAFFVRSNGVAGNVDFKERYKRDTSNLATRPNDGKVPSIRITLNGGTVGAPQVMLDGALAIFGDEYGNDVNFQDAAKFTNAGINVGYVRNGKTLAVERRQMPTENDTLHVGFTGAKQLAYTWEVELENIDVPGLQAWMWDKFLNTRSPLQNSSITNINFSVDNNASSTAADRFKIVFTQEVILPVRITNIQALRVDKTSIALDWNVKNENNVTHYIIERSANGATFKSLAEQKPLNNNLSEVSYNYLDAQALPGDNYYRIKMFNADGTIQYSNIVRVKAFAGPTMVNVMPNPVRNQEMNLVFTSKPFGKYDLSLTNSSGQTVYKGQITIATDLESRKIRLVGVVTAGVYQLTITGPDKNTLVQKVMIE